MQAACTTKFKVNGTNRLCDFDEQLETLKRELGCGPKYYEQSRLLLNADQARFVANLTNDGAC